MGSTENSEAYICVNGTIPFFIFQLYQCLNTGGQRSSNKENTSNKHKLEIIHGKNTNNTKKKN